MADASKEVESIVQSQQAPFLSPQGHRLMYSGQHGNMNSCKLGYKICPARSVTRKCDGSQWHSIKITILYKLAIDILWFQKACISIRWICTVLKPNVLLHCLFFLCRVILQSKSHSILHFLFRMNIYIPKAYNMHILYFQVIYKK